MANPKHSPIAETLQALGHLLTATLMLECEGESFLKHFPAIEDKPAAEAIMRLLDADRLTGARDTLDQLLAHIEKIQATLN